MSTRSARSSITCSPGGRRSSAFNFGELFAKVRAGTPEPIASIEPEAPARSGRDRRACDGARTPTTAIPTARELADDLRRFQTGQLVGAHRYSLRELLFRWARRHAPVLAAVVVALVVITVGGVLAVNRIMDEHAVAIDQSAIAKKNQSDAEQLMQFMLYDLRRRLMDLGRIDLLETAARKAASYYDGHHGNDTDDDRADEATSREEIAEVLVIKGARSAAMTELDAAQALATTIPPTSRAFGRGLHVRTDIALVRGRDRLANGDTAGALATFREAERLSTQMIALAPDDRISLLSKAKVESEIAGVVETRGDRAAALVAERIALKLASVIHGPAPDPDLDLVRSSLTPTSVTCSMPTTTSAEHSWSSARRSILEPSRHKRIRRACCGRGICRPATTRSARCCAPART